MDSSVYLSVRAASPSAAFTASLSADLSAFSFSAAILASTFAFALSTSV